MMAKKKLNTIEDLSAIIIERYLDLADIREEYLSERGLAAKEAYRSALWHLGFYDKEEAIKILDTDEQFKELVSIPDKHPEYYKILRMINRAVESASS